MGEIQNLIEQHVSLENCFVKSIQIIEKEDSYVIVPIGFNIRFINCKIGTIIARDSAIHFLGGSAEDLQLNECIVSMDAFTVNKSLQAFDTRINIKELPDIINPVDITLSSLESKINGNINFTNVESFWNTVSWTDGSGITSKFINSRVEFDNCKINLTSELEIRGTEWYNLNGEDYSFSKPVLIQELESYPSTNDPEIELDSNGVPSKNKMRGTAGVGPGSICQFKGLKKLSLTSTGTFDIKNSEVNFYSLSEINSQSKPFATYTNSCGRVSDCKISSRDNGIKLLESGNLYLNDTELTSDKVSITIEGSGSNITISKGKFESNSDNCFSINKGLIDLFSVESIKAKKDTFVGDDNSTIIMLNCKTIEASENTFNLKSQSVLESENNQTFKGKINFKGENSSFLIKGNTSLEASEKVVSGSGVFVSQS